MQSFVSHGKDVKEAVQLGLELMEVTKKEVNIEILSTGSKGFWGIGAKKAVVKLTREMDFISTGDEPVIAGEYIGQRLETIAEESGYLESVIQDTDSHALPEGLKQEDISLNGKVWVKDGQLYMKESPVQYPLVTIGKGIELIKNNQLVKEKTIIVTEKDNLEIRLTEEEQPARWKVSVDQDRLRTWLKVIPGYTLKHSLPDIDPAEHIKLVAVEEKQIINTIAYQEVISELESLGVRQGFNQGELEKALGATEEGTYEIASGTKAKQGKNGWVELKVEIDTKNGLQEETSGKIDYREIKTIPTVDNGKVIAIIHPAIPGQPGTTVTNEPLPARQTHPVIIKTGKGVMVVDDKIVATESGRPLVEQRGQLVKASILPRLVHNKNVNLKSGNIHFNGDVEITGDIEENMTVEAGGDILVHRSIHMSVVTAADAIIAKRNVVGSELSAGKNNMLVAELGHLLGIMHKQVEAMIRVIIQLTNESAFKSNDIARGGLQPLITILMERKFKSFIPLAKKYVEVTKRGESYLEDDEWQQIGVTITQVFLTLSNQLTSLEKLKRLAEKMKKMHDWSKEPIEPDSYIIIPSALDSSLYCSGDITISGQGCVNTKIHAGGRLKVQGVVRGGEVYGRLGAEIKEAGAESGTATVISVPSDQTVYIGKAYEGTIIKIGSKYYTCSEPKYNIKARLNQEEEITFV